MQIGTQCGYVDPSGYSYTYNSSVVLGQRRVQAVPYSLSNRYILLVDLIKET